MAISVDYTTYEITIGKVDGEAGMTQTSVTPDIWQLDLNAFRVALKDWEDSQDGLPMPDTHRHNTEVSLGGLTFARVIEVLAPYTFTFQDGQYAVNFLGANTNLADRVNVNQVSVRPNNSAGLIVVTSGSGITEQDKIDIRTEIDNNSTQLAAIKTNTNLIPGAL